MRHKISILSFSIVICITVVFLFVFRTVKQSDNPDIVIIKAVTALQRAFKNKDILNLWELNSDMTKQRYDSDYEKFNVFITKWYQEFPEEVEAHINARLGIVKIITPKRAWVKCDSSNEYLKGFQMVKENGNWKFLQFTIPRRRIRDEVTILNKAIKKYYADKSSLPYSLSELVPTYLKAMPLDPYSEEGKPYNYEILGEDKWLVYSIGIDGKDDRALIESDIMENYDFDIGDVVIKDEIR